MKIIFQDQLGCYAALVAAAYYTGVLQETPSLSDITTLPSFADHTNLLPGNLFYLGKDQEDNEIYTLGVGREGKVIATSIYDLFRILNKSEIVYVIDVSSINFLPLRLLWYLKMIRPLRRSVTIASAFLIKSKMPQIIDYIKNERMNITS